SFWFLGFSGDFCFAFLGFLVLPPSVIAPGFVLLCSLVFLLYLCLALLENFGFFLLFSAKHW
ncbi:putative membrane protein, partial [Chlamydia psittaci 08-2626_L3]